MEAGEISLKEGDWITGIVRESDDWWEGTDRYGNTGVFPGTSV